jgi:hypothetical protein
MKEYARVKVKPYDPYSLLAQWYVTAYGAKGRADALDALERAVTEREPKAVLTRVRYVCLACVCSCVSYDCAPER